MTARRVFVAAVTHGSRVGGDVPLPHRVTRNLSATGVAAVRAALAVADRETRRDGARLGIFSATGPARFDDAEIARLLAELNPAGPLWEGGLRALPPLVLLRVMSCNVLAVLSILLGARGPSAHLCGDATSGLAALADARHAVARGALDEAVVVAYDGTSESPSVAALRLSSCAGGRIEIADVVVGAGRALVTQDGAASALANIARAIDARRVGRLSLDVGCVVLADD